MLERLYDRPIVSVADIEQLIETTYPAANSLVGRLEALGILNDVTGQKRNRRSCYQPYGQLFGEDVREAETTSRICVPLGQPHAMANRRVITSGC